MYSQPRLTLVLALAISMAATAAAGDPPLQARFHSDGVSVFEGDHPVLTYQRAVKSFEGGWPRAHYVHPLYDLSGNVVTEDFPDDHRHHRGVFWAWHQVWVGDRKLGDAWTCKDFVWDVRSLEAVSPASPMTISADVVWQSPDHVDDRGEMIPVVREQTDITVHAASETYRSIDFLISMQALAEDVRIGGSEDDKGYGGFSPRIKLSDDQRFLSADGQVQPVKTAVQAGPWINIVRDGSGVAMMVHESNPKSNDGWPWILRRQRSMQNAVYPGRDAAALSADQPTVLRYRLVVHDGSLSAAELDSIQREFCQSN